MSRLFVRPRPKRLARQSDQPRTAGAFLGSVPGSLDRAAAMEQWLDLSLDCQTVFEPWAMDSGEIFALFARLRAIWEAGRVPLLTWEAFTPTPAATPPAVLPRAADGAFDEYLISWATALVDWLAGPDGELGTTDDRRLYLRPLHEPNGDWYPWAPAAGGFRPATYVRVWRRMHRLLTEAGVPATHVTWIWAVNHVDAGDITAEALYPGADVVDLVGVDGFNWGATHSWSEWRTPTAVFGDMLERVRAISNRPVCIPEFATTSMTVTGPDSGPKNAWLREAFTYFREQDIVLAAYFDIEKETDWQVFGGSHGANTIRIEGTRYQTYPGFRRGVREYRGTDSV